MKSMSEISWLIYVPGTAFIDLFFPTAFQVTLCFLSFMEEVFTFIMTLRYSSILKMSFIVCKTFLKLFFFFPVEHSVINGIDILLSRLVYRC